MALETRVWGNRTSANLFTTIPRIVRGQLEVGPDDRVVWRLDGSAAEVRRRRDDDTGQGNVVYKQARSNSIYVAIPVAVQEQLRFSPRSRVEWELLGSTARIRRS